MKVSELKKKEFIEFDIAFKVETHQEFKDLYGAVYGIKSLEPLTSALLSYSDTERISV